MTGVQTCALPILQSYAGTVFLVSHDRRFLDNVVTSLIAWEGDIGPAGFWREYEGGIEDWRVQRGRMLAARTSAQMSPAVTLTPSTAKKSSTKLSYKEQRELAELPARIESLEAEQIHLNVALADGGLYAKEPQRAAQMTARVTEIDAVLMAALERWEVLGSR